MVDYTLVGKRVWVAGHRGMVGSAIVRRLAQEDCEVLTVTKDTLDLRDQAGVAAWIADHRPDAVVLAAARVGGILANATRPVDFLLDNLLIETAVIAGAHAAGVEKLLFLGSTCIYPKLAAQPISEDALLTGPLEQTNEWYAIAKIAGIKLVQAYRQQYGSNFISAMPTNLYGSGDNYDLDGSHVLPALIRKTHRAKVDGTALSIWGTGAPRREFLHVDDCADACIHLLRQYSDVSPVNIGCSEDVTILELANMIGKIIGFDGIIETDPSKPDGTPRKLTDTSRLRSLGWSPRIGLEEGIADAYADYLRRDGAGEFTD